jgi:hypothetical protein
VPLPHYSARHIIKEERQGTSSNPRLEVFTTVKKEAARSSETLVSYRDYGVTTQKTSDFKQVMMFIKNYLVAKRKRRTKMSPFAKQYCPPPQL